MKKRTMAAAAIHINQMLKICHISSSIFKQIIYFKTDCQLTNKHQ